MMSKFYKAVWGGPNYEEGKDAVAPMVNRLAKAGFDLIIPFVECGNGSVHYHSKIASVSPDFKDWDFLAVLAEEAENAGLKVHPCLSPFNGGEGSVVLQRDKSLQAKTRDEKSSKRCCPAAKAVRKYKLNLYEELMDNYPIAGVHMDGIRYNSEDECFCENCRSGFKAETGTDPVEIGRSSQFNILIERGHNRRHPSWDRWIQWRAGWITRFVEELSELTKKKNKRLSAAVFMEYPECIVYEGQDWADWAERGLLDYVFPMTYTNSTLMVKRRTRNHIAQIKGGCHVWEGLGKRSSRSSLSTQALIEQTKVSLKEGAEGIVIFSYASLTDEDLDALSRLR